MQIYGYSGHNSDNTRFKIHCTACSVYTNNCNWISRGNLHCFETPTISDIEVDIFDSTQDDYTLNKTMTASKLLFALFCIKFSVFLPYINLRNPIKFWNQKGFVLFESQGLKSKFKHPSTKIDFSCCRYSAYLYKSVYLAGSVCRSVLSYWIWLITKHILVENCLELSV